LPAELAVLALELKAGESGAWMNSRGSKTGAVDLVRAPAGSKRKFHTVRTALPVLVSKTIRAIYAADSLERGCADLVLVDT
jgi:hypothetical protein